MGTIEIEREVEVVVVNGDGYSLAKKEGVVNLYRKCPHSI